MKRNMIFLFTILSMLFACSDEGGNNGGNIPNSPDNNDPIWDIPQNQVFDGGPGKDGIPALFQPNFTELSSAEDYMSEDDLVLGVKVGDDIRGYTHPILDWHEIINDELNGQKFAITYCPLTGTGINWNRELGGEETTFGVSGLLYNTNLLPYDRKTGSNWSQMAMKCVNGELRGDDIEVFQVIETSWSTWKELFPESLVTSTSTGYSRNYGIYPYGDYKTDHNYMLFPVSPDDTRLDRKERVLGIVKDGNAKVYQFHHFQTSGNGTKVIMDQFGGEDFVIVGNEDKNFMVAFERTLDDGTLLNFIPSSTITGAVMTDNEGNQWNLFGEAVLGPRLGEKLNSPNSLIGYWLAWGAFYPDAEIYE